MASLWLFFFFFSIPPFTTFIKSDGSRILSSAIASHHWSCRERYREQGCIGRSPGNGVPVVAGSQGRQVGLGPVHSRGHPRPLVDERFDFVWLRPVHQRVGDRDVDASLQVRERFYSTHTYNRPGDRLYQNRGNLYPLFHWIHRAVSTSCCEREYGLFSLVCWFCSEFRPPSLSLSLSLHTV